MVSVHRRDSSPSMPKSQNLNSSPGQEDIKRSMKRKRKKRSYKKLMGDLTSGAPSKLSDELMRKKHGLGGGVFEKIQKI